MNQRRIRVSGKPRQEINLDLLAQAIVAIVEQQLLSEAPSERARDDDHNGDAA